MVKCQELIIERGIMRGGSRDEFSQPDGERPLVWTKSVGVRPSFLADFSDVPPVAFPIHYEEKYDPDDPYPHPHRLDDLDDEGRDEVSRYAKDLDDPGLSMSIGNLFFIFRCAVGTMRYTLNPFVRRARYYAESLGSDIEDAARPGGGVCPSDSMARVRLSMCLHFALSFEDMAKGSEGSIEGVSVDEVLSLLYVEAFEYLFSDPFYRTKTYKGLCGLHLQSAFCMSSRGVTLNWLAQNSFFDSPDFSLSHAEPRFFEGLTNDRAYYERPSIQAALRENEKLLTETGLVITRMLCVYLLRADVNHSNLRLVTVLEHIRSLTGFTRTKAAVSHRQTMEGAKVETPVNPPYATHLRAVWTEFYTWMFREGGQHVMTDEELTLSAPFFMTSRSAGGSFNVIPFEVADPEPGPRNRKKNIEFSGRSKALVYLLDPYLATDFSEVGRGYTIDRPGVLASRHVPDGKAARAVMMQSLQRFLGEIPMGDRLYSYQLRKRERMFKDTFDLPLVFSSNDYIVGRDTGVITHDHAAGLYASSRAEVLISDEDYDAFDVHQKNDNMRSIILSALFDFAKPINPVYALLGGVDFMDIMRTIWGSGNVYNAYYVSRDSVRSEIIEADQLGSGEFMTLSINNMSNQALSRHFYSRVKESGMDLRMIRQRKQGDDSEAYYRFVGDPPDSQTLEAFVNLGSDSARENGYSLNVTKTVTRFHYAEFIKKRFIHGYEVPRLHVQYFNAERVSKNIDLLDEIRGKRSTFSVMAMRGSNPEFLYRMLFFYYLIRANTQYVSPERIKSLVYYPPVGFFTPLGLKGVGVYPGTILGSNVDASCAYLIKNDPVLRRLVNTYASLLSVNVPSKGDAIARYAVKKGVRLKGEKQFKPIKGIKFIDDSVRRLMGARYKDSLEAVAALASFNYRLSRDLQFADYAETLVKRELKNASAARTIDHLNHQRAIQRSLFRARASSKDFVGGFLPWLNSVAVDQKDVEGSNIPHPFVCTHRSVSKLFSHFGIRTWEGQQSLRPIEILNFLRRMDRFFPKHYDPEVVFKTLMDQTVLSNPEVLRLILIAMGMHSLKAGNAATALIQRQQDFMSESEFMGMSYGDAFFSALKPPSPHEYGSVTPNPKVNRFIAAFLRQYEVVESAASGQPIQAAASLSGKLPSVRLLSEFGHMVVHKKIFANGDHELHGLTQHDW
jgi:hypothetical protein